MSCKTYLGSNIASVIQIQIPIKGMIRRWSNLVNKLINDSMIHFRIFQIDHALLSKYLEAIDLQKDLSLLNTYGLNDKERKKWEIGLCDRLLHPNLAAYLQERLTNEEKKKIEINRELM